MSYLPSMPDGNLLDCFRRYPELAAPLHEFAEALMRGDCPLSPADRELIAVYVSAWNQCDFCRDSHAAALARLSDDAPPADAAIADPDLAQVRPAMRPVLAYARKLTEAPAGVRPQDIDAVLEAGWDERAVVYANLVAGFFALMNRWVEGLGFPTDPHVVEQAGQMLAGQGYGAINRMLER